MNIHINLLKLITSMILIVFSKNMDYLLFSIEFLIECYLLLIKRFFFHNSPENLRMKLNKNDSRNLKNYLRKSGNLIEPMSKTANGEKTFEYFYTRLMNSFVIKRSMLKFATFKLSYTNFFNKIIN
ncbi:hypothetical protein BpHYR1_012962 [Brachionus plicatilis]|uniref:Uncharacterized protein n=1 Tax=Brachionus plicatilis TaxID=10195 RepID=A0A3M7RBT0_BRAPC|nr:hypothetical protein BpHYR1_012962 [Brachionus plicatilis]